MSIYSVDGAYTKGWLLMISFSYDDPDPQLTTSYVVTWIIRRGGEEPIVVAVGAVVVDPYSSTDGDGLH